MSQENMDSAADLLTLVDEDGKEHEFEVVDQLEREGSEYVALVPVFDEADQTLQDSGELIILKVVTEEDGEEVLEAVEDDDEFHEIGEAFKERLKDSFDFED